MQSLRPRLRAAVESFWFIPALLLVTSVVVAEVVVSVDRAMVGRGLAELPFVNAVGASGSRDLLAAIGGSMLGVAATSFSITISVIATASSTYGPRLVRNFTANRGNQVVLGIFGATFLYTLLVLRTVREETSTSTEFVPHLAVTLAILLAVVDVAVLIYFIHHIADSIEVATLAAQVLTDLERSVAEDQPDTSEKAEPETVVPAGEPTHLVRARDHGFLRLADHAALVDLATEFGGFVRLCIRPGDHVVRGDVLIEAWLSEGRDEGVVQRRLGDQLDIGRSRTPRQDLRYATQQIVELAVRAMSPGTNDPYTAINAVIELGTGLCVVIDRVDPGNGYRREGVWRLLVDTTPAAELVELAFDHLRPYAVSSTEVVLAMLEMCTILGRRTDRADITAALVRQEAALRRQYAATQPERRDQERVDSYTVAVRS